MSDTHIYCHPPDARVTNVGIIGLRSCIDDSDVNDVLSQYEEIKGEFIRLKYKADHDLAGVENGNRLVMMLLEKKSIPYSLRIGGEWCRVIHNNQQPMCNECHQIGHTRKRCSEIECKICKEKGHMSCICEQRNVCVDNAEKRTEVVTESSMNPNPAQNPAITKSSDAIVKSNLPDADRENVKDENNTEAMDTEHNVQSCKRLLSDSDTEFKTVVRRQRLHPVPNLTRSRQRDQGNVENEKKIV